MKLVYFFGRFPKMFSACQKPNMGECSRNIKLRDTLVEERPWICRQNNCLLL